MRKKQLRSHCPINFGLETFGDKWSLLIIRDIVFRGKKTYGEFLKSEEGFATNILATRLEHLESVGIIRKEIDSEDNRKNRYSLSEKGIDLIPMLFELMLWSAKYDEKSEARRIPKLIESIRAGDLVLRQEIMHHIRGGQALFPHYLD